MDQTKKMIETKVRADNFDQSKYNFKPTEDEKAWIIGNEVLYTAAGAYKNGAADCPVNLTVPTYFRDDFGVAKPVEIIGQYAFFSCGDSGMTKSVKVTKQVKVIRSNALGGMNKVEHFEIEEGSILTTIEAGALQSFGVSRENQDIRSTFVLPKSVNSVAEKAFQICPLFETIIYCGSTILDNKTSLSGVTVKVTKDYIDTNIFGLNMVDKTNAEETEKFCKEFADPPGFAYTDVDGGFEVTGWKNNTGYHCPPDLKIPEILYGRSVVSIKNKVFENCETEGPILLPSSLKRVRKSAFAGMSHVTAVNSSAPGLVIEENAFMGCGINAEQPINVSMHEQTQLDKSAFNKAKIGEVYLI